MKKGKFSKIIQILFFIIVIGMCSLGCIFSFIYTMIFDKVHTILTILGYTVSIIGIYFLLKKININKKWIEISILLAIILLGLILRISSNRVLQTIPVSDFKTPHVVHEKLDNGIFNKKSSNTELSKYQLYYAKYPAWFPYMKIVSFIYDTFGQNLINIKIMNWVFYVLSAILIYIICKKNNKKNALFAVFLFALFPPLITYSSVTTPDHITIFLFLLLVWLWSKMFEFRKKDNWKKLILYSVLNILCFCLINLFKPLSIFGIVLFICVEILCYIKPLFNKETRRKYVKKDLIFVILFIILSFFSLKTCNFVLKKVVEKNINNNVVDSTGMYMLWGYSIDNKGEYNPDIATDKYNELLIKNNNNLKNTMNEINALAKKQFINNISIFPKIIYQKAKILFATEQDIFSWSNRNTDEMIKINNKYKDDYVVIANTYMCLIYIMIIIYAIKQVLKIKNEEGINQISVVCSLIIVGYFIVLLLGSVQSRYKTLVYGVMCILASNSLTLRKEVKDEGISNNTML